MDPADKEIDHLCSLAKLDVSPARRDRLVKDLKEILGFVKRLREVDTEGIDPTEERSSAERSAARDDRCEKGLDREDAIRAAPDALRGHFRVPRVL